MSDPKHTQEGMDDAYANRPGPKRPTAALVVGGIGPAHQFTGNRPGVVGADNCQICFKWHDEHAEWEATPPDMITAQWPLEAAERRGIERAAKFLKDRADREVKTQHGEDIDPAVISALLDASRSILALSPSHVETAEAEKAKIVKWLREAARSDWNAPMRDEIRNRLNIVADAIERGDFDPTERDGGST